MPNHCDQTVTFKGKPLIIKVLYESVLAESLCQIVKPMPFELRYREGDSAYLWAVKNWGTKWDIADPVVLEDKSWNQESELWVSKGEASFTFECWTAYAPPFPIWEELFNNHQIQINASYIDDGGFFNGTFTNGEINAKD